MPRPKIFCFQLHLDEDERPSGWRPEQIRTFITSAGGRVANEKFGYDNGSHINISASTDYPSDFWNRIDNRLGESEEIMRSLIVVCEGANGWDDYLLLRHYDADEETDRLLEER